MKLIPLALGMLVSSPLAGIYADRHGSRGLAALGMLVSAAGARRDDHAAGRHPLLAEHAVAAGGGRGLGDVQQPQHRRDDGHRARQAPRDRRGRAHAAAEHRRGAVDRVRDGDRHLRRPPPTLFAVFSGLAKGLSAQKLAPFIDNMHTALWVLAATSLVGAGVCLMRPRHARREPRSDRSAIGQPRLERARESPCSQRRRVRTRSGTSSALRSALVSAPLRIGDVARLVGTTPRTIRYYEEIGLLAEAPARPSGQHRTYTEAEVERLREVMRLKSLLGVTLEELKTLLSAEEARAEVRAQLRRDDVHPERRHELLQEALGHIDRQLELVEHRSAELAKLKEELTETRARVRRKLRELDQRRPRRSPPETVVATAARDTPQRLRGYIPALSTATSAYAVSSAAAAASPCAASATASSPAARSAPSAPTTPPGTPPPGSRWPSRTSR